MPSAHCQCWLKLVAIFGRCESTLDGISSVRDHALYSRSANECIDLRDDLLDEFVCCRLSDRSFHL